MGVGTGVGAAVGEIVGSLDGVAVGLLDGNVVGYRDYMYPKMLYNIHLPVYYV